MEASVKCASELYVSLYSLEWGATEKNIQRCGCCLHPLTVKYFTCRGDQIEGMGISGLPINLWFEDGVWDVWRANTLWGREAKDSIRIYEPSTHSRYYLCAVQQKHEWKLERPNVKMSTSHRCLTSKWAPAIDVCWGLSENRNEIPEHRRKVYANVQKHRWRKRRQRIS
jgi:hypothetical protein